MEERQTLTVEEAATILGISHRHGYEMVRRGELPALHLGQRWVIPRAALERLLSEASGDTPPQVPVKV